MNMKRGLIFALDAAVAATILVVVILNSFYYFSTSSTESLSQIQLVKIGGDIINAFEVDGTLESVVINIASEPQAETTEISQNVLPLNKTLPPNYEMWVQILDVRKEELEEIDGPGSGYKDAEINIAEGGSYYVQIGVDKTEGNPKVEAWVNDDDENSQKIDTPTTGVYTFPQLFVFVPGLNIIHTHATGGASVGWYRVLGTGGFAASTNESTDFSIPNDRFVGSGERVITVYNPNPGFEVWTMHWVRYLIWVTTE